MPFRLSFLAKQSGCEEYRMEDNEGEVDTEIDEEHVECHFVAHRCSLLLYEIPLTETI